MMARLTPAQRERAIGMLAGGISPANVARTFNVHVSTITRLRERFRITGRTDDAPRSGRPPCTTRRQDRYITVTHLRDRFRPATRTAAAMRGRRNRTISAQTVRNRLRASGLNARRPYNGPVLLQRHRNARLNWALAHQGWRRNQWNQVVFSDESRFSLFFADGRRRVYRRRNERYADCCVRQIDRFRGGSVMVWGAISNNFRSNLVIIRGNLTAQHYINQVLAPEVVPLFANRALTFQHDHAPSHSARVTTAFLQQNNVNVLPWPSVSPDMSPIEHLWDELNRRIRRRPVPPPTLQALEVALVQEWNRIPQATIRRLIGSMRQRCRVCVNNRGGHTRY